MSKEKKDHVVIALLENEAAAEAAKDALEKWDKDDKDLKLGNIGWIYMKDGKVKTHMGHKTGKGVETGAILGIIAGVLSGGLTVVAGAIGAGALGGIAGAFFKKSTNLTKENIEAIGKELESGQVALIVTCKESDVEAVNSELTTLGASATAYAVKDGALTEAGEAMDAAGVAPPTDTDDSTEASDAPASSD